MIKQYFCLCENKGADQLRSNCEADQRLCFRYTDSIFLNPKFPVSSHLLCLYSSVCVGPGRKPRRLAFSRRGSHHRGTNPRTLCMENMPTVKVQIADLNCHFRTFSKYGSHQVHEV